MKLCFSCKRLLNKNQFNIANKRSDGVSVYCKKCKHIKYLAKYHRETFKKKCKRCGTEFEGFKNATTCGKCPRPHKPISGYRNCLFCNDQFPFRESLKVRGCGKIGSVKQKFCSIKCANTFRNKSDDMRKSASKTNKGKVWSIESRKKMSISRTGKPVFANRGAHHHWWKGGITPENTKIRMSFDLREWRRAVYKRDNFTCQFCFLRGGVLHAHHQKPFVRFLKDRDNVANGVTLCRSCHRTTPFNMVIPLCA